MHVRIEALFPLRSLNILQCSDCLFVYISHGLIFFFTSDVVDDASIMRVCSNLTVEGEASFWEPIQRVADMRIVLESFLACSFG